MFTWLKSIIGSETTYFPLNSVGLIQAYCQTIPQIADNFHFQDFIYLRSDPEAASSQMESPAVVGISCYILNWEWSRAQAQSVNKHHS